MKTNKLVTLHRTIKIIYFIAILLPLGWFIYRGAVMTYHAAEYQFYRIFFSYNKIDCQINNIFSASLREEIKTFINQQYANGNLLRFNQGDFYSGIRDKFNVIKSVSYRYIPPKTLLVQIEGVLPMFVVNQTSLVAENRRCYSLENFSDYPIAILPAPTVNPAFINTDLNQNVYELFSSAHQDLWQRFTITYEGLHDITLQQKHADKTITIITDHYSFFDTEKFNQIAAIEQNLIAKKKILESRNYELVFDMRFKKRIITKIVDLGRRGRRNEKSITR